MSLQNLIFQKVYKNEDKVYMNIKKNHYLPFQIDLVHNYHNYHYK